MTDIPVTAHALRRYIERIVGFEAYSKADWRVIAKFENATGQSVETIRAIIASEVSGRVPATVVFNGTRRIIRGQTARFVVENGHVMTCYPLTEAAE